MITLRQTKMNNTLTIHTTKIEDGYMNFTGLFETIALLSDGDELDCVRCDNECDAISNHNSMVNKLSKYYIANEAY